MRKILFDRFMNALLSLIYILNPVPTQVWSGCGANGKAVVEIVHNANGGHEWPEQAGWSSTKYILDWFYARTQ